MPETDTKIIKIQIDNPSIFKFYYFFLFFQEDNHNKVLSTFKVYMLNLYTLLLKSLVRNRGACLLHSLRTMSSH